MISSALVNATLDILAAPVAMTGMITPYRLRNPGERAASLPMPYANVHAEVTANPYACV